MEDVSFRERLEFSHMLLITAHSLESGCSFDYIGRILARDFSHMPVGAKLAELCDGNIDLISCQMFVTAIESMPAARYCAVGPMIRVAIRTGATIADLLKQMAHHSFDLALLYNKKFDDQIDIQYLEELAQLMNVVALYIRAGVSANGAIADMKSSEVPICHSQVAQDLTQVGFGQIRDLKSKYSDQYFHLFETSYSIYIITCGNMSEGFDALAELFRKIIVEKVS